jgi:hypothetical protein
LMISYDLFFGKKKVLRECTSRGLMRVFLVSFVVRSATDWRAFLNIHCSASGC